LPALTGGEIEECPGIIKRRKETRVAFDSFDQGENLLGRNPVEVGFKQLMQTFESARIKPRKPALWASRNRLMLDTICAGPLPVW
jgi:hypothetical protein